MTPAETRSTPRTRRSHHVRRPDTGSALPLMMVFLTIMASAVILLANYALSDLRYARITENRSDRLSAADAGMRYAIDQLKLRNAGCILDTQKAVLPGVEADFNGATATVTCERITSGFEGIQAYAAVMTGEGLAASESLLSSQSGSNEKTLGGPVFMSRVDTTAFALSPPVKIENGPLLYHDTTGERPCRSVRASTMPPNLVFEPELIFGPVCVSVSWEEIFDSPAVPDLSALPDRDGSAPIGAPNGSFTDLAGGGGCRVFEPGRYTTPPATAGVDAYFLTGDYLFDFDATWEVRQSNVIAGRVNPLTTTTNELPTNGQCGSAQSNDPAAADQFGATFYFARGARMNVATQGSVEIHARRQGPADYVSVQALCAPNGIWCNEDGDGSLPVPAPSTLRAPAADTSGNLLFTDSGNNKEFVAHALVYAPLAQVEFGNVSNTATQKMLGGLIVSRLVLQSSTSATNFEIAVPTSPITAEIALTSTAVKEGATSIQAVVEYRPYESSIDERVRINSWRVCERATCDRVDVVPTCDGGDAAWTATYFDNTTLSGTPEHTETLSAVDRNWGTGSPHATVPNDYFSARFERRVDLPGAGTYRFTLSSDDGQRLFVDGATVIDDWNDQTFTAGTNVVDVVIDDPCGVDLVVEYFENTGQAAVRLGWVRL